ncbi:MAG: O-antigen ligase family protein [Candidatus Cloacimonetes bacterium]|nr:O-antigen ligase family protein [Candidatus Cloacimonadota bacterium]
MAHKDKSNKLELFLLTVSSIIILPLLYLTKTIDPVITIRFLFLAFVLFLVNIILIFRTKIYKDKYYIFKQLIFISFLGYIFFSVLSLINTTNITEGIFDLSKVILYGILFIAAVLILNNNENNINIVCKTIIISSIIISSIGLIQYFFNGLYFIPGVDVVYSTFTNRNLFSSVVFLTLPFALYGYFTFSKKWLIISLISICFSFFIITIIKARSVWVAILFSLFIQVLVIFVFKKKIYFRKVLFPKKFIPLSLSIIAIVVFAFLSPNLIEIRDSSEKSSHMGRKDITAIGTFKYRLQAWEKTVQMIKEYPLLGVGVGNWKIMLPKYGVTGMKTEKGAYQYIRPHNDFFWVFGEIGIFGFLFYLSIFILIIYYIIRIIFKSTNRNDKLFSYILLFGFNGYIIVSLFSFPKERIFHSIIFIFIVSIVTVIYNRNFPPKKPVKYFFSICVIILNILMLSSMLWFCYHRLKSEVHLYFALRARQMMDIRTHIAAISEINPSFYNMSPMGIPIHWYRGIAYYELNQIDQAFTDFKEAYTKHPHHIYIINNLASCYEILKKHQEAIKYYNKVLEISPKFEESLINLSAVYYNIKNYKKAYEVINRCDTETTNPKCHNYKKRIKAKLDKVIQNEKSS